VSRGWEKSSCAETADLAVINTCSVRDTAEQRIHGRLGWYTSLKAVRNGAKTAKPFAFPRAASYAKTGAGPLTLVIMGCMAERLSDVLKKKYPVIDYIVGNFQKQQFSSIIQAVETSCAYDVVKETVFEFLPQTADYTFHGMGESCAYLPVMHGCNNFCSYCIVPYLRGREVSRAPESILAELDLLAARNVREVTLLGQNVNAYRHPGGEASPDIDFPALVNLILEHLDNTDSPVRRVRFLSGHPKDLSRALIETIASNGRMCRHIHLPVQHGSTRILKAMNRQYTREDYLEKVRLIREILPDSSLSTDILVGFPGETEEDIDETIALMNEVRFEAAFTYFYNPREGTPAASFTDQVPPDVKKERLARIIDTYLSVARGQMLKRVGTDAVVLVDGVSRDSTGEYVGRTEQDSHVVFPGPAHSSEDLIGSFVRLKLTELTGNTFRGIIIPEF
jgi:tRNA-2-methylthio-N6-dimethylallyladenosine synthase